MSCKIIKVLTPTVFAVRSKNLLAGGGLKKWHITYSCDPGAKAPSGFSRLERLCLPRLLHPHFSPPQTYSLLYRRVGTLHTTKTLCAIANRLGEKIVKTAKVAERRRRY
jgi:hypothetical protein